jgi:hypothetical protein
VNEEQADSTPRPGDETVYPLWFPELMPGGRGAGFLEKTDRHSLMFVARSAPRLLVTFDNLSNVRDRSPLRLPWAYKFARDHKASHLGILAHRADWYREAGLIERMRKLAGEGFFEGYERVLFAGSSMGAFGALAFSALAPGAHVLAFNPQSTLNPELVPWETRYRGGRAQDWSLPFGDAAGLLGAAGRVGVFYDPYFEPDRRHFDRLAGPGVTGFKCWYSNHKSAVFLRKIGALKPVMESALFGELTEAEFYRLYRARRGLPWYAGSLRGYFDARGRAAMAARVRPAFRQSRTAAE